VRQKEPKAPKSASKETLRVPRKSASKETQSVPEKVCQKKNQQFFRASSFGMLFLKTVKRLSK